MPAAGLRHRCHRDGHPVADGARSSGARVVPSARHQPRVPHHPPLVRGTGQPRRIVIHEHHASPAPSPLPHHRRQLVPRRGVEPRPRLVQHQQLRIAEQRLRHRDLLRRPLRQLLHRGPGELRRPEPLQPLSTLRRRHTPHPRVVPQVLSRRERQRRRKPLRHVSRRRTSAAPVRWTAPRSPRSPAAASTSRSRCSPGSARPAPAATPAAHRAAPTARRSDTACRSRQEAQLQLPLGSAGRCLPRKREAKREAEREAKTAAEKPHRPPSSPRSPTEAATTPAAAMNPPIISGPS